MSLEAGSQADRQPAADSKPGKRLGSVPDSQAGRQVGRQAGRHAGRQPGRQAVRQAGSQAAKQPGSQPPSLRACRLREGIFADPSVQRLLRGLSRALMVLGRPGWSAGWSAGGPIQLSDQRCLFASSDLVPVVSFAVPLPSPAPLRCALTPSAAPQSHFSLASASACFALLLPLQTCWLSHNKVAKSQHVMVVRLLLNKDTSDNHGCLA